MGQSPRCATPPAGSTASRVNTTSRLMRTPPSPLKGICTRVDLLGELRPGEALLGVGDDARRPGGDLPRPPCDPAARGAIRWPAAAARLHRVAGSRPAVRLCGSRSEEHTSELQSPSNLVC